MSAFNEANEFASQLVWGRHYQVDEPCAKLDHLVLVRSDDRMAISAPANPTHKAWADIAMQIEVLLHEGWEVELDDEQRQCTESAAGQPRGTMSATCEFMPMMLGTYQKPAPEPEVCGLPAEVRLRVTYYNDDRTVAQVSEAYSCLVCFCEALRHSGHNNSDFDPLFDDLDGFDSSHHNPAYGPKYEILQEP